MLFLWMPGDSDLEGKLEGDSRSRGNTLPIPQTDPLLPVREGDRILTLPALPGRRDLSVRWIKLTRSSSKF